MSGLANQRGSTVDEVAATRPLLSVKEGEG